MKMYVFPTINLKYVYVIIIFYVIYCGFSLKMCKKLYFIKYHLIFTERF